jgi:WD40 repeat protein
MIPASPYVGLNYFREQDAEVFFGREAERKRITGNLRATRLTLLYAQSGVGKSSLLRAGVVASQREVARRMQAESGSPGFVPVVHSRWRDDPVEALTTALETAARSFDDRLTLPRKGLEPALERVAEALDARPLVILDQFEELLAYHDDDEAGERFAEEFARCVLRPDLPANFLLSIREDAYSKIGDRFQTRIPNVYGNYLHLDYLDHEAAREAIEQPLAHVNRSLPEDRQLKIGDGLVEAVLADALREDAADRNGDGAARYETAYLQLVMKHIWEQESSLHSTVLRRETLQQLGGGAAIIEAHLEGALKALSPEERSAAASAFGYLGTSAGTKNALTAAELADLSGRPERLLVPALKRLDDARILRAVASSDHDTRYELFHDMLAGSVSDWRRRHQAGERAQEQLHEQRTRLVRKAAFGLVVLVLLLVGAVVWALQERSIAKSRALAANALSELPVDPELGIVLAKEAYQEHATADAEAALRRTLAASFVRGRMKLPTSKHPIDIAANGTVVAAARNDHVELLNPAVEQKIYERDAPGGGIDWVRVAAQGGAAAIKDSKRTEVVRAVRGAKPVALRDSAGVYVILSAKGDFAAGYDEFHEAHVWDTRDGRKHDVTALDYSWTVLAFDPVDPGRLVAGDCFGSELRVSRWRTDDAPTVLKDRQDSGAGAALTRSSCTITISPDGRRAVETLLSGSARLWDLERQRFISLLGRREAVSHVAWSPNSQRVAIAAGKTATVFSRNGRQLARPAGHTDFTNTVAFNVLGKLLVTSSRDNTARVWDVDSGTLIADLRGHDDEVLLAGFAPGGGDVITLSADGSARRWSVDAARTLRGHRNWVLSAAVDRSWRGSGARVAGASVDGSALIWTPSRKSISVQSGKRGSRLSHSVAFDTAGRRLALTGEDREGESQLLIANAMTGAVEHDLYTSHPVTAAQFSPIDRNKLVTGSAEGPVEFWDLAVKPPKPTPLGSGDERWAQSVEFSSDGRWIVTAGIDGVARIFNAQTRRMAQDYDKHGAVLYGATFSPDGKRVLSFGSDGTAHIWDAKTGEQQRVLHGHTSWVSSGAWSPGGRWVVTGSADHATRVWDAETGKLLSTQVMHGDSVNSVAFTPKREIVSASDDWTVRVYTCATCGSAEDLLERAEERTQSRELTDDERKRYLEGSG